MSTRPQRHIRTAARSVATPVTASAAELVNTVFIAADNSAPWDKAAAHFVATGAGTDEDTWQDAVDYLPNATLDGDEPIAPSGRILAAAGNYIHSSSFTVKHGISIVGVGPSTVMQALVDSDPFYFIKVPGGCNHTSFADFAINGQVFEHSADTPRHCGITFGSNSDYSDIGNVEFIGLGGVGVSTIHGGDYRRIHNCLFKWCGVYDSFATGYLDYGTLTPHSDYPNTVPTAASYGAAILHSGAYDKIVNNKFLFTDHDCIFSYGGDFLTITGNEFSDCGGGNSAFFNGYNTFSVAVTGNQGNLAGGMFAAIRKPNSFQGGTAHTITGNTSTWNPGGYRADVDENYGAILIKARGGLPTKANVISGNTFYGGCVLDGAGCIDNLIEGNTWNGRVFNPKRTGDVAITGMSSGDSCIILMVNGASTNKISNNICRGDGSTILHPVCISDAACTSNRIGGNDLTYRTGSAILDNGTTTDSATVANYT